MDRCRILQIPLDLIKKELKQSLLSLVCGVTFLLVYVNILFCLFIIIIETVELMDLIVLQVLPYLVIREGMFQL